MQQQTAQPHAALMSSDPMLAGRAASALQAKGLMLWNHTAQHVSEFTSVLRESQAPVAVVAVNGDASPRFQELASLVNQHPRTRFVAMVDRLSPELLRQAMQAGMRQAVARDELDQQLPEVVSHLLHEAPRTQNAGRSTLVLSAAGGTGATTVAINLAAEQASAQPSGLLVELDLHCPAHTTCLDLHTEYGLDNVVRYGGPIDAHLIRSTAVPYNDDLHVLANPPQHPLVEPTALTPERGTELLRACGEGYQRIILDAPRLPTDFAAALSRIVDHVLIVFQVNVKELRATQRLLASLHQAGIDTHKVTAIANRYPYRRQPLRLGELRKALSGWTVQPLANDYRHAQAALSDGCPLKRTAPRAPLRRAMRKLTATMERASNAPRTTGDSP
jgi:pilus assembly protein CpaE